MKTIIHSKPPKTSWWSRTKKRMKKIMYLFITLIIIFLGLFVYWKYFYTYSDGYHSGELQKFSHKGNFIKTYEGEMILRSLPGKLNEPTIPGKFSFTVTDKNIALQLDSMQGQMVFIHYKQKNGTLFWRSNSRYIVDSVKLIR